MCWDSSVLPTDHKQERLLVPCTHPLAYFVSRSVTSLTNCKRMHRSCLSSASTVIRQHHRKAQLIQGRAFSRSTGLYDDASSSSSSSADAITADGRYQRPIYVAATKQHVGKTSVSLALVSGLKKRFGKVGFIKPVGQQH
eukprot:14234890-Ditylum_brightwellii.AAC.1